LETALDDPAFGYELEGVSFVSFGEIGKPPSQSAIMCRAISASSGGSSLKIDKST
jgi:hypothetical protein